MTGAVEERRLDGARLAWLLVGVAGLVAGTALGWDASLLDALVAPPDLVRAALVGASAVVGLWLLGGATARLRRGTAAHEAAARDLPSMIRGVRLVFLAVAAFAAGAGWLLGHPLPFVVALVIAGVDILETSFLLLVVATRRG